MCYNDVIMNARLKELLALPEQERAEIADALYASLEAAAAAPDQDVEQAWRSELDERIADVDAERVALVPASDVIRDLQIELQRLR